MRRHSAWILAGVVVAACGGSPGSSPEDTNSTSPPPSGDVRYTGPATVKNEWTTVVGTVTLVSVGGTSRLLISTPEVNAHFVASAEFVFRDPSAPSVGTYTAADAAPGTTFEDTSLGGDVDWWETGVGGSGGSATLTFDEVSSQAVHGRLSVDLRFALFDATF
jgi:hypothetical protein